MLTARKLPIFLKKAYRAPQAVKVSAIAIVIQQFNV